METYNILRRIGRGCYGDVQLAECLKNNKVRTRQVYAIKRVQLEEEELANCEVLNNEVKVLASLNHPNIIRYYENFVHEDFLCIVMYYADDGDLHKRIREIRDKNNKLPEVTIWSWFTQLCQALSYIHSRKIIHRDLKSQNIFLTTQGKIKIGDFGISKIMQSQEFAQTRVGTPYYLSPEICRGNSYDQKSDIWSLGCILYEMCALKRPFEADNLAGVVNKIINEDFNDIPENFSAELTYIVDMLLVKDPNLRPTIDQILAHDIVMTKVIQYGLQEEESKNGDLSSSSSGSEKPSQFKKRSYQKEISINIPTPTSQMHGKGRLIKQQPHSAPNVKKIISPSDVDNSRVTEPQRVQSTIHANLPRPSPSKQDALSTMRTSRTFSFPESMLKSVPNSPNRPMLMSEFLRKKLGTETFERVKRVMQNTKDPARLLKEEPWIISDICGEKNLSIIDVGIAFDVFNAENRTLHPPTWPNSVYERKRHGFSDFD